MKPSTISSLNPPSAFSSVDVNLNGSALSILPSPAISVSSGLYLNSLKFNEANPLLYSLMSEVLGIILTSCLDGDIWWTMYVSSKIKTSSLVVGLVKSNSALLKYFSPSWRISPFHNSPFSSTKNTLGLPPLCLKKLYTTLYFPAIKPHSLNSLPGFIWTKSDLAPDFFILETIKLSSES